jgi:hypothetical protein
MTDQGNEPTRADTPVVGGPHDPTVVGVPAVDPEPTPQTGATEGPPPGTPPPWGPGGPAPDRRPWIIAGLLALVAVLAIALLLIGDDEDDVDSVGTTSTTVEDTTTSEETTTSETTTTEVTTTSEAATATEAPPVTADPAQCREAGADPTDPESAAEAVFVAWTRGDEACAAELMTDDALDELFARDGTGATDDFQGCTEQVDPEPHMDCAFTYEGGATHYKLVFSPTDGWQVYDIEQVAD